MTELRAVKNIGFRKNQSKYILFQKITRINEYEIYNIIFIDFSEI